MTDGRIRRVMAQLGLMDPRWGARAIRVGVGYDVHPFVEGDSERVLVLGGVGFPGEPALAGHSDSDVVAHAVTDAVLGAAGLGDIGQHFPDTDDRFSGADSLVLLREAVRLVLASGWRPQNADCTVILDRPKVAPHRGEMEERMSSALGAAVTVKATRTEGLGPLAAGAGIACHAVALVVAR